MQRFFLKMRMQQHMQWQQQQVGGAGNTGTEISVSVTIDFRPMIDSVLHPSIHNGNTSSWKTDFVMTSMVVTFVNFGRLLVQRKSWYIVFSS